MDETFRQFQDRLEWILSRDMVFIVGATRWGTTWVQHALDAHPEIACKGEGHFSDILFPAIGEAFDTYNRRVDGLSRRLEDAGFPPSEAGYTRDEVVFLTRSAVLLTMSRWIGDKAVRVIGEKTPEQVLSIEALGNAFPNAKFIHVVRDGRDEAISAWEFNQLTNARAFADKYPTFERFAEVFAKNWTQSVGMAHGFGRQHPQRYIEVCCEHFLDRPTPTMIELARFLGVDRRDQQVLSCIEAGFVAAPLDVGFGHWRDHFNDAAILAFQRNSGELLKLLEYDREEETV